MGLIYQYDNIYCESNQFDDCPVPVCDGDGSTCNTPTATDMSITVDEDGSKNFVLSASDPTNDDLDAQIVSQPAHGEVVVILGLNVSYTPEYNFSGSDEFNDHHFHYGYFIYAAAILAQYDADFLSAHKDGINLLVADIANYKTGEELPLRRAYDPYAGHSWASGAAPFSDGNNQESSSEAINAWTGVALWGEVSGNDALEMQAGWLLSNEALTAQRYWLTSPEGSGCL